MADLLDRVLAAQPPAFALLHRPESTGPDQLDLLLGEITTPATLADLPAPTGQPGRHEVLAVVPYRQIGERGYAHTDDGAPLLALHVTEQALLPVAEVLRRLPDERISLADGHFEPADDEYAQTVRRVVAEQIGDGAGANFVIKRSFLAEITGYTLRHALTFFRRLLANESGAYWTFIVHTGARTFVGATPERHISVRDGVAVMNPISGTYRYPPSGPSLPEVLEFLADRKETDELYMVVDEELKMMARICATGGRVVGPYLKEMAKLAHTEYFIEGRTTRDPREILHETLFAPTVTGSPLESACRVISRYEPRGRGYYSGIAALISTDETGQHTLDSAILIRTAALDAHGRVDIGVGATLVRHSDPDSEVAETRAKAAGLLAALQAPRRFGTDPTVRAALADRNTEIAGFWLGRGETRPDPVLAGRSVLVVDAEDTFTAMLDHQLRALGLSVTVRRYDEPYSFADHDLVVMGPGPGDPRERTDPKIRRLGESIDALLLAGTPFLAVCLSHQVLSLRLGLPLNRRPVPNQGVQREIEVFGARERVGFYNTFAASSATDAIDHPDAGPVQISRDPATGEVHALRGRHFASMQFHAESVLTKDGVRIIGNLLEGVLAHESHDRMVAAG